MNKYALQLLAAGLSLGMTTAAVAADYNRTPRSSMDSTTSNVDNSASMQRTEGSVSLSSGQVRELQQKLSSEGFSPGLVDGVLGPRTRAAIRRFQEDNGLSVTGTATEETLSELGVSTSQGVNTNPVSDDINATGMDSTDDNSTYR